MAASTASLAIGKSKPFLIINQTRKPHSPNPSSLPVPHQTLIKPSPPTTSIAKNAAVNSSPIAMAAKKISDTPQQDIRGPAFLVPVIPAVGWALVNIMGPAMNQLERMMTQRGMILGLGLGLGFGGLAAATINLVPSASAVSEVVEGGAVSGDNNQLYLALFIAAAAALEVVLLSANLKEYESEEKRVTK